MIDSDMLLTLCEARANEQEVRIIVDDCLYACCSQPLSRRAGYIQTYRGVVANLDERTLLLHSIALKTLNYHVVVDLDHVEDVTLEAP